MTYNTVIEQSCISVFAIFLGSQITEGFLLVPYWQSLSSEEFYAYYLQFGPVIGRFYTVLTIVAALIPIGVAVQCTVKKAPGIPYAVVSAIFAVLFVSSFYLYFKDVNASFYLAKLNPTDLTQELVRWNYWHWARIVLEVFSLLFLIVAFAKPDIKNHSQLPTLGLAETH